MPLLRERQWCKFSGLQSSSRGCRQRCAKRLREVKVERNLCRTLHSLSEGCVEPSACPKLPSSVPQDTYLVENVQRFCSVVSPLESSAMQEARQWLYSQSVGPYDGITRGAVVPLNVALLDIPFVGGISHEAVGVTEFSAVPVKSASDLFLPVEARSITASSYSDPALKNGVREALAVRLLENGLCKISKPDPYGRAMPVDVFAVSKAAATPENPTPDQRLVWDCRRVNEAIKPAPSFSLGSLAALSELEMPEPGFLELAATDVSAYFYRLTLPGLEQLLFLADVDIARVAGLLKAKGRKDLLGDWVGASMSERATLILGMKCLPMGLSWSPCLAQTVAETLISEELPKSKSSTAQTKLIRYRDPPVELDHRNNEAAMVYLDDITMVRYSKDRNVERRRQHARRFLEDVKQVFDERNLLTHKDQGPASELEVLGCEVETAGSPDIPGPICIRPSPKKLEKLIAATEFIIRKRKIRVRQLQKVLGLWTFFFGLRRGFFSIFDKVYSPQYSRMFAPTLPGGEPAPCAPNDRFVVLQADAILELRAAINIAPLLVAEVSQEIDTTVFVSDGSPVGCAVCVASVAPIAQPSPSTSIFVAHKRIPFSSMVQYDRIPKRRWRVAAKYAFSDRARRSSQNVRELRGIHLGVKRIRTRNRKIIFFSDSEVAIGALKKGRSSSPGVNFYCRRICAEAVVRNVTIIFRHVAGKNNFADAPSRGMSWPGVLT